MLADSRALEEESERYNPVNPKTKLGTRKGRTSLVAEGAEYTGGGATPSLGLSQFRGGAMSGCGEDSDGERLVGAGTKKGQRRKTARRAYESKSEASEMGHALGEHIHSLHGGGFFDDFARGFMSVVRPIAKVAKVVAPIVSPGMGSLVSAGLGALGAGKTGAGQLTITHGGKKGRRKGKGTTGAGYTGAGNVSGPGYEAVSGGGFLSSLGIPILSDIAGAVGLGHRDGAGMKGCGTGAGKRVNKRAEVVKQVMRDRGVSMIEASKIVKAEGLY